MICSGNQEQEAFPTERNLLHNPRGERRARQTVVAAVAMVLIKLISGRRLSA
jgi:hypothetical protein